MARAVFGRYSVSGNADRQMSQAHYRPRAFDVGFQSDRNRVYRAPSARGNMIFPQTRTGIVNHTWSTGSLAIRTGDLGDMASEEYLEVLKKYASVGGKFGEAVVETASKALAVARDVSTGAAMGATFGPIGAGAGAVIAGIYSTFNNFGDDISHFFNPPSISEDRYDGMKKNCVRSGGIPNFGHAPDNEDGCIYPDGTMSGGDYPRHPPAGVQRVRGDNFIDYDLIAKSTICVGRNGVLIQLKPGEVCAPGVGPIRDPSLPPLPPAPPTPTQLAALLPTGTAAQVKAAGDRARSAQAAVAKADALRKGLAVPAAAQAVLTANVQKPIVTPSTRALITVAAAMTGDPKAAVDLRNTVDAARAGDATAIADARLMTHAQRLIMINSFLQLYLGNVSTATSGVRARTAGGCGCGGGCQ